MDLEQLLQELEKVTKRMEELNAAVLDKDGKARNFSDEESREWEQLTQRSDELNGAIKRAEALERNQARIRQLNKPANERPKVEVIREDGCNEEGEPRYFRSLGEQLQAVAKFERSHKVDERLEKINRAASGASEGIGADGGFLLQSDFAVAVFDRSKQAGMIASLCDVAEKSSPGNSIEIAQVDETSRATGSRYGGVQGYWRAEAESVTAKKPKIRRDRLSLEALEAVAYVTDEELEDTALLNSILVPAFVNELAWLLDDAVINGDGAGKPLGIINSPALISVAKEGSQTADTIVYGNVRKMRHRMWSPSYAGAQWFYHADVPQQLEQMLIAGASSDSPIYMPPGGLAAREHDTLYGRPAKVIEQCKALGDLGDILFADFKEYLLIRKGGLRASESAHVKFLTSEMTFKFSMRVNGQPKWRSALTDANGSGTRSPFVSLAERA